MIVVADSGPLHYLILLGQTSLLHRLYGDVLVPEAVADELGAARAPREVRAWISQPPAWLTLIPVALEEIGLITDNLDVGERAAIALAERVQPDFLLIDETDGRAEAIRRSLRVTGTLGVLRAAAEEGLLDVRDTLARLALTNFYADDTLLESVFGKWLTRSPQSNPTGRAIFSQALRPHHTGSVASSSITYSLRQTPAYRHH
jgi:predicted nucleic acid-binding protein